MFKSLVFDIKDPTFILFLGLIGFVLLLFIIVYFSFFKSKGKKQLNVQQKSHIQENFLKSESGNKDSTSASISSSHALDVSGNTSLEGPHSASKSFSKSLSWPERLSLGFSKSRSHVWSKISELLSRQNLEQDTKDSLEALLYQADLPGSIVASVLSKLESKKIEDKGNLNNALKTILSEFIVSPENSVQKMEDFWQKKSDVTIPHSELSNIKDKDPYIIMIVGVNGAGKTTTIGKMAYKFAGLGYRVFVAAADTFRAAAVEQLQLWCERAEATCIQGKQGQDPASVVYETINQAKKAGADICLLDTAGRLHNNTGLMDELIKMKKVIQKWGSQYPQETFLVIDSMMGQNALKQAKQFHEALGLTGIILTKCDGSSKAGAAIGIMSELKVPVRLVGVGETVEDLDLFKADQYVNALLETESALVQNQGGDL